MDADRIQRIWADHERIHRHTRGILDAIVEGADHEAVVARLDSLGSELVAHFRLEERDGYLREVKEIAPEQGPLIDRLGGTHADLEARLHELRDLVAHEADRSVIRNVAIAWVDALGLHEAAENRLLALCRRARRDQPRAAS
ncbi:MAG: hemerythrin domain-containing protein [Acidobacteriota bacterium]